MLTVHIRVNDQATGQPTPCRLRITDQHGNYHAPFGRLIRFATGKFEDVGGNLLLANKAYAYIDGSCEIKLPAGPLHVEISKGPEYRPLVDNIELAPGKIALRFTLERFADLRAQGWLAGDTRAHALSPHAALLEGRAEDLAVVNLLACEERLGLVQLNNMLAFSGQEPALAAPDCVVAVNTYNRHPELGSLALLNSHRAVFPLTFGGRGQHDDWTLADWCDQCHRKGGLVVWANTTHESEHFRLGEPLADLLVGKVDAFEVTFFEDSPYDVLPDWYRLLNVGLHVPLVGASGKERNFSPLGAMRTYARVDNPATLDYRAWIEAVRAGRTFISNGPLLDFKVQGQEPGAMLAHEKGQPVHIEAAARSQVPFERLEVLANGEVIAQATATEGAARLEVDWQPTSTCWLAARCLGRTRVPGYPAPQTVFAHSSSVYAKLGQEPFPVLAAAKAELTTPLDELLHWARNRARCPLDRDRQALIDIFEQARQRLDER